jgi:hypothetical protein
MFLPFVSQLTLQKMVRKIKYHFLVLIVSKKPMEKVPALIEIHGQHFGGIWN